MFIDLARSEAEFIVDACEATNVPEWWDLAVRVRKKWGMRVPSIQISICNGILAMWATVIKDETP